MAEEKNQMLIDIVAEDKTKEGFDSVKKSIKDTADAAKELGASIGNGMKAATDSMKGVQSQADSLGKKLNSVSDEQSKIVKRFTTINNDGKYEFFSIDEKKKIQSVKQELQEVELLIDRVVRGDKDISVIAKNKLVTDIKEVEAELKDYQAALLSTQRNIKKDIWTEEAKEKARIEKEGRKAKSIQSLYGGYYPEQETTTKYLGTRDDKGVLRFFSVDEQKDIRTVKQELQEVNILLERLYRGDKIKVLDDKNVLFDSPEEAKRALQNYKTELQKIQDAVKNDNVSVYAAQKQKEHLKEQARQKKEEERFLREQETQRRRYLERKRKEEERAAKEQEREQRRVVRNYIKEQERAQKAEAQRQEKIKNLQRNYNSELVAAQALINNQLRISSSFYARSIANANKYRQALEALGVSTKNLKPHPFLSLPNDSELIDGAKAKDTLPNGITDMVGWRKAWDDAKQIVSAVKDFVKELSDINVSMQGNISKIYQNLELYPKYHNMTNGANQLKNDLSTIQNAILDFAVSYGMKIEDVGESFSVLSRRFKDVDTLMFVEDAAIKIARLDNIDLKTVSTDLEAIILQLGLSGDQLKEFVNQSAVAVHSTRITGQELLDALKRSGSAFKAVNADLKTTIATISTMSTITGREGGTIGNVFRGILSYEQKDSKKIREAFEMLGVERYMDKVDEVTDEASGQVRQVFRNQRELFLEMFEGYNKLDDKQKSFVTQAISGGVYRVNEMRAFFEQGQDVFKKLISELDTASDEVTEKLMEASLGNYATAVDKLTVTFDAFKNVVGEGALPVMQDVVKELTLMGIWALKNRDNIRDLSSKVSNLTYELGLTMAAMLPIIGSAAGLLALNGVFGTLTASVALFGAQVAVASAAVFGLIHLYRQYQYYQDPNNIEKEKLGMYKGMVEAWTPDKTVWDGDQQIHIYSEDKKERQKKFANIHIISPDNEHYTVGENGENIGRLKEQITVMDGNQKERALKEAKEYLKQSTELMESYKPSMAAGQRKMNEEHGSTKTTTDTTNNGELPQSDKRGKSGSGSSSSVDNSVSAWQPDLYKRNKYQQQLRTEEYENKVKEIALARKYSSEYAKSGVELKNEKKRLEDLQIAADEAKQSFESNTKAIDDFIKSNEEINAVLAEQKVTWAELSAEERKDIAERTKDKSFKKFVSEQDEVRKAVQQTTQALEEQRQKVWAMDNYTPLEKIEKMKKDATINYNLSVSNIEFTTKGAVDAWQDKYRAELQKLKDEQKAANEELMFYKQQLDDALASGAPLKTVDKLRSKVNELQASVNNLNREVKEKSTEAWQALREAGANTFNELLVEGKSFKDIWKGLWNELKRTAINAIFGIQSNNIWTKIFGSFVNIGGDNGGGGGGFAKGGSLSKYRTGGSLGAFSNGGKNTSHYIQGAGTGTSDSILAYIASKDKFVYLSNGEYVMTAEATKRIGKSNLDNMNYNKYATGGLINPTPYVPSISSSVEKAAVNLPSRSSRTEELLMQQNKQMAEQIGIMRNMGQSEGGKMVVLNTQASSADVLRALQENPRAVQALMGRQKRMGFK